MSQGLNIEEQVALIDADIQEQKEYIQRGRDLDKLFGMKEFQNVFIDGYINEELERLLVLITSPHAKSPEGRQELMNKMDQIRCFKEYIGDGNYRGTVGIMASNADKLIIDSEALKRELLNPSKAEV
jgi:hypothetical protein